MEIVYLSHQQRAKWLFWAGTNIIIIHLSVIKRDQQKGMIRGRIIKIERYWKPDGQWWEKRPDIQRLPYTDEHGITFVFPAVGYKGIGDEICVSELLASPNYPI